MKKLFTTLIILILVMTCTVGCASSSKETDTTKYVVVSAPSDIDLEETFDFQNISRSVISDPVENSIEEGVYNAGVLSDGNSIIWRSDNHDNTFVYVEEKVTKPISYVSKLDEDTISFDEFLSKYDY